MVRQQSDNYTNRPLPGAINITRKPQAAGEESAPFWWNGLLACAGCAAPIFVTANLRWETASLRCRRCGYRFRTTSVEQVLERLKKVLLLGDE